MKNLLIATLGVLLLASPAFARGKLMKDGRNARPAVQKYYKAKGWSKNIRVHSVRKSISGKSLQTAVLTKASGKVRLFNVNRRTGKVSATRTGLLSQSKARLKAHRQMRRERAPLKGTYSGVYKSGLSNSGKRYNFKSKTDRNQVGYVGIKKGSFRQFDGTLRRPQHKTPKLFK